ncbi:hypothetical protein MRO97_10700, partial [Dickeya dianthicola]|uniref:hypothetical protein n=1 Tax=Dickeya dianthicola TaxID=204039 RepID=UPI001F6042FE
NKENKENEFIILLPVTSAIIRCPLILPFLLPDLKPSSFCQGDSEKKKITLWKINGGVKTDGEKLYQAILSTELLNDLYSIEEMQDVASDQKNKTPVQNQESGTPSEDNYLYISRLPISGCFITQGKNTKGTKGTAASQPDNQ